jgi:hypothetical protein
MVERRRSHHIRSRFPLAAGPWWSQYRKNWREQSMHGRGRHKDLGHDPVVVIFTPSGTRFPARAAPDIVCPRQR